MPRPRPGTNLDKPKDFKQTAKKLINTYLSKYKVALIVVFLFAIGGTIFTIVGPKILGNATTEIFNGVVGKLSGGEGINFGKGFGGSFLGCSFLGLSNFDNKAKKFCLFVLMTSPGLVPVTGLDSDPFIYDFSC